MCIRDRYLAGNKNLYENDVLKLGTVKLTGADGTTVGIGAGELGVVSACLLYTSRCV